MNNYQLNNTSVYLGGQCRWDLVLDSKDDSLCVSDFHLSPISRIVPYNIDTNSYLLNYDHGYNLKTFYNSIKGNFWNTDYIIDSQSRYDTSRYAGCCRRETYHSYEKQFEYFQPLWLEQLDNQSLKFTFSCYSLKKEDDGSLSRRAKIAQRSLVLKPADTQTFHTKFVDYFKNWLGVLNIDQGNSKVAYVSFEKNQFMIDGVNVETGVPTGPMEENYIINNFCLYERPLIETDHMISAVFKEHNMVVSQLFNFNFCFNIEDLMDPITYSYIKSSPISVDCEVCLVDSSDNETLLTKRSLLTNYTDVKKSEMENFLIVEGSSFNYSEDKIDGNSWIPSEQTKKQLDSGTISTNVFDYLKDYEYPEFFPLNKFTQDIIHWKYLGDSSKTFNLYNGYRGLIRIPYINESGDVEVKSGNQCPYTLSYDDFSNGFSVWEHQTEDALKSNGLGWVAPGKILWMQNIDDFAKLTYYPSEYIDQYGVSVSDVSNFWNVDIEIFNSIFGDQSTETPVEIISKFYNKVLLVYAHSGKITDLSDLGEFHSYTSNVSYCVRPRGSQNDLILVTTDLNNFLLPNLVQFVDEGEEITDISKISLFLQLISWVVYEYNSGVRVKFKTEITYDYTDEKLVYYKSKDHKTFPIRHSGEISPADCDEVVNHIYYLYDDSSMGIDMNTDLDYFEYHGDHTHSGWIRGLQTSLDYTCVLSAGESWKENVKGYLQNLYKLPDSLVDYIYNLYEFNMNFTHQTEDKIEYKIKMNLL